MIVPQLKAFVQATLAGVSVCENYASTRKPLYKQIKALIAMIENTLKVKFVGKGK